MIKQLLKKIVLLVGLPVRLCVRHELALSGALADDKNIARVLQRRAVESTADYVATKMANVDSVTTNYELLSRAFSRADLSRHGLICEFGVYSGGTINHIASLTDAKVYGFDSFEGLPERWRDGFLAGHFKVPNLPKVRGNVVLKKGWFDSTLPKFMAEDTRNVGFLHIDCDLYSSTVTIFNQMEGRIKSGSVIVFDEYFNYPGWEGGSIRRFKSLLQGLGLSMSILVTIGCMSKWLW